jgi:hypothetical protein
MSTTRNISVGRYSADHVVSGLCIPEHDHITLSYTGSNVTGIVYRFGGASGITVATLTLTYDGSGNVTTISRV